MGNTAIGLAFIDARNDPAAAPTPGTVVPCPAKGGAQIAVMRCVEWQVANGCHCAHALVSLRAAHSLTQIPVSRSQESAEDGRARLRRRAELRQLLVRAEQLENLRVAPVGLVTEIKQGLKRERRCNYSFCGKAFMPPPATWRGGRPDEFCCADHQRLNRNLRRRDHMAAKRKAAVNG